MAVNWIGLGLALLERLPLEKILVRSERKVSEIEVLEGILARQQAGAPQVAPAPTRAPVMDRPLEPAGSVSYNPGDGIRVTTEETIAYQRRELGKELLLLEKHLQQGCKIGGKACDCCEKHPIVIEGLALETMGMSPDPVFGEVLSFAQRIAPITTEAASRSGVYTNQYPNLAMESREIRKRLTGTTDIRALLSPELESKVQESMQELMEHQPKTETAKESNDGRSESD